MGIKLFTDRTADFPPAELIRLHIETLRVPCEWEDGGEVPTETENEIQNFYEKMRAGARPKTSQVNPQTMLDAFEPCLQNGDDVLYLAFTSGVSGICRNGQMVAGELAEKYPGRRVVVVDTLSGSAPQGMLAMFAAEKIQSGANIDEVAAYIESIKLRVRHFFTVGDMRYLFRSGRISAVTAAIGSLLSIRPVLALDREGKIFCSAKVQGRKRALKYMLDRMAEDVREPSKAPLYICHTDCRDEADALAKLFCEKLGKTPDRVGYVTPVIGAHTGPGTVAVFYLADKDRA